MASGDLQVPEHGGGLPRGPGKLGSQKTGPESRSRSCHLKAGNTEGASQETAVWHAAFPLQGEPARRNMEARRQLPA